MSTLQGLRQTYLNIYLKRTDGDTVPWADADCNQALTDAITKLWPDAGQRIEGTQPSSSSSGVYTLPTGMARLIRIDVEDSTGRVVDQVTNWRYRWDADPPTKVVIKPWIVSGYTLRFFGWKEWTLAALTTDTEPTVCYLGASLCYGILAASLANSQRQQALDSGRVVDYQTAIGLAAYWRQQYVDNLDPNRPSGALRRARR